jgi:cytochrome c5
MRALQPVTHKLISLLVATTCVLGASAHAAGRDNPPVYPAINYSKVSHPDIVKKGEYLAKASDCMACHTAHGGKPFAGGLGIETPFGAFFSPNITADDETGIGKWTDQQFIDAVREGHGSQGNEFPVMPYVYYNKMSNADVLAIKEYLFAVPKVRNVPPANQVPWPFNVRLAQFGWKLLFFYPYRGEFKPDPSKPADWNRGKFLVEGPTHCGMCHSPLNMLGAEKLKYRYTGGFVQGYYAVDITSKGLEKYSVNDVVRVLKEGKTLNGKGEVAGPMREAYEDSFRYLTDSDLHSIAVYLKTVVSETPKQTTEAVTSETGAKVYNKYCSSCHAVGANGAPAFGDKSAWETRLKPEGFDKMVDNAVNGLNSMPPMGNCVTCSKDAIRATVQYMVDSAESSTATGQNSRDFFAGLPKLTMAQGATLYKDNCAVCHDTGKNGAPKIGDSKTWLPIFAAQNFDDILTVVIKGHSALDSDLSHPENGGCAKCSTAEVIAATKYLAQQGTDGKYDFSLW